MLGVKLHSLSPKVVRTNNTAPYAKSADIIPKNKAYIGAYRGVGSISLYLGRAYVEVTDSKALTNLLFLSIIGTESLSLSTSSNSIV